MSLDISRLTAIIAEKNSVIDSAATLIASLSEKLKAASSQDASLLQATIDQLAHDLDTHGSALADAVAANTPAA